MPLSRCAAVICHRVRLALLRSVLINLVHRIIVGLGQMPGEFRIIRQGADGIIIHRFLTVQAVQHDCIARPVIKSGMQRQRRIARKRKTLIVHSINEHGIHDHAGLATRHAFGRKRVETGTDRVIP